MALNLIGGCRESISKLLALVQQATQLEIRFTTLPSDAGVFAQYYFDPHKQIPTIRLGNSATDVDVAHELIHMQLELVDGFSVPGWRHGVDHFNGAESAFGLIRSYVDDEVVHRRLLDLGLTFDGEIIRPPFFEDICTTVPVHLNRGAARALDGMTHLDGIGCGHLRRMCFLIQGELIRKNYSGQVTPDHNNRLTLFLDTFRNWRRPESLLADVVLEWFSDYDVQTAAGHHEIVSHWLEFESLLGYVGMSHYQKTNGKFLLPWPA